MKLHGNARTCPRSRCLAVGRVEQEGWTLARAAEAAGVSVRTLSKWLRRFREEGKPGLHDRSSAPSVIPHRTPEERVVAIAALRRLRMTGAEIAECLRMPHSTVSAVLTRIGLGKLSGLEPAEPANRYERKRPGELLHIDIKKLGRIARPGHRVTGNRRKRRRGIGWEYVHVCVDDATRLAYVEVLEDEKAATAVGRSPSRNRPLPRARDPNRAGHDRQRLLLPRHHPRPRLQSTPDQTPTHPPLPPTHQRQSRTLHPHHARRLGLRRHLRQLTRTPTRPPRLARLLQSRTTTPLPQSPTTNTTAGGAQTEQPS